MFINPATPGYVLATIAGAPVVALFDGFYTDPMGMASSVPILTVASADVSGAVHGTLVVAGAVNYTVQGIEPDGAGVTRLILQKT